ncbi:hypothetical protein COLO4_06767 [Corchorus olitorius]|uniref:Uncharacterized protein n=1 Tax=Corchorus olitorius TaxID=93759 RepID=A0A1R3KM02_9ROSI|nr:hypothetical protein COLO4_06767 [Corchorus olitorius]
MSGRGGVNEGEVQFTEPAERFHQGENCGGFDEVARKNPVRLICNA